MINRPSKRFDMVSPLLFKYRMVLEGQPQASTWELDRLINILSRSKVWLVEFPCMALAVTLGIDRSFYS